MKKDVTVERFNQGPLSKFFVNGKISVSNICNFCEYNGIVPPETEDDHACLHWIAFNEKMLLKILKSYYANKS